MSHARFNVSSIFHLKLLYQYSCYAQAAHRLLPLMHPQSALQELILDVQLSSYQHSVAILHLQRLFVPLSQFLRQANRLYWLQLTITPENYASHSVFHDLLSTVRFPRCLQRLLLNQSGFVHPTHFVVEGNLLYLNEQLLRMRERL